MTFDSISGLALWLHRTHYTALKVEAGKRQTCYSSWLSTKRRKALCAFPPRRSAGSDHVLSIYDNDEAFIRLLEHAELDADTIGSLKGSAELAYGSQNTPTCCEDVELTEAQLNILRLGEAKRLYA